jgi:hypothetical protein
MSYTIGELANALNEVAESLDGIARSIDKCNQKAEIDATPDRTAICSHPVIVSGSCKPVVPVTFTVSDLAHTVGGLRDWTMDVVSKLGNYAPSAPIDVAPWPTTDK